MVEREAGLALIALGVAVLLFVVYELFGTNLAEQHSQAKLAHQFQTAVSRPATGTSGGSDGPPTAPKPDGSDLKARPSSHTSAVSPKPAGNPAGEVVPPLPPPGGALDHLVIPAIGVDRYVVEGVDEADLQMGPGHYPGTPLPGQAGNVAIAGHRTTFGAPFFDLNELTDGDLIYLTDLSGTTWVYSVEHQWVVAPTDVAILGRTRGADLTLTTCNPRFLATSRLVVRAVLVDRLSRGAKFQGQLPVRLAALLGHRSQTAKPVPVAKAKTGTDPVATLTAPTKAAPTTAISTLPSTAGSGGANDSPVVGPVSAGQEAVPQTGGAWTWVTALGWGALAIAVWAAARFLAARRHRYTKVALLLGGALACLVPLWFAFGAVVDLLPANF